MATESSGAVGVIVVHWCNAARTRTCVDDLLEIPADRLPTIVVFDNGSPDGSGIHLKEAYQNEPRVRVVLNPTNLGFGGGVNEALRYIGDPRPDFVLLVNPDARLPSESLEKMLKVAQGDVGIGAVGPTIVYQASGLIVWQAGAEFDRCLARVVDRNKGRTVDKVKTQKPKPVDFLTGAVVLIRTKALEAVGGFDPAYFLYEEDLDLSFRLRSAGYKLVWVPEAVAYHDIAIADRYRPEVLYHRARSRVIFLQKHFAPPYLWYALAIHFVVLTLVHGVRSLWFQRSFKPIWQWIRGSVHGLRGGGRQATVVVDGFYGGRNWGDEQILRGVISGLKRARVQRIGQIVVLSADPAKTREWHGVTAVKYVSVQAIWCLGRSRWLLIGGGGLFPGTWRSLLRRLTLVLLARLLARRVSYVGVGLEPWRNALEQTLMRLMFRLGHDVVVRDSVSVELLRRLGITKARKASDFAFLALEGNRVRIPRGGNDEPPTVTVALNGVMRREEPDAGHRALVDSLSTCALQGPLRVKFVVSCKEDGDELAAREIAASLPKSIEVDVVEPTTPDEWLSAVVRSSVVVTERLHPGIVASAHGIPVFVLCSRPKLSGWAREFHWRDDLSSLSRCLQESSMTTRLEAEEVVREHASSLERAIARIAAEIKG